MSRADAALYAAKRSGRNRVRTWDEHMRSGDDGQLLGTSESAQHSVLNGY